MSITQGTKKARIVRIASLTGLYLLCALVLPFSLLSGSEEYGKGVYSLLLNAPNAIPWIVLLLITFYATFRHRSGGLFIIIYAITLYLALFFRIGQFEFGVPLVLLTLVTLFGIGLVIPKP
jgi:succinate dehydrogenase/fumarate reductase cytochrome b subunit